MSPLDHHFEPMLECEMTCFSPKYIRIRFRNYGSVFVSLDLSLTTIHRLFIGRILSGQQHGNSSDSLLKKSSASFLTTQTHLDTSGIETISFPTIDFGVVILNHLLPSTMVLENLVFDTNGQLPTTLSSETDQPPNTRSNMRRSGLQWFSLLFSSKPSPLDPLLRNGSRKPIAIDEVLIWKTIYVHEFNEVVAPSTLRHISEMVLRLYVVRKLI